MNKRLYLLYLILSTLTTSVVCFDAEKLIEKALAIVQECMEHEHGHGHVPPHKVNKKLKKLLDHRTLDELIALMIKAEKLDNPYLINAIAAAIAHKLGHCPTGQQLIALRAQLSSLSYAFVIGHLKCKKELCATRACEGTPLSIAEYVALNGVPVQYLGNIAILRFDDKNINSLDGLQDISMEDVGIVVISNNCIVGSDLDPQFPTDPFQGIPNTFYLIADNNLIESLPSTFFSSVTLMGEIYLGNNLITTFPDTLFSGLDQLGLLELSYNMLSTITASDIQGLSTLNLLYLDHNSLVEITSDLFDENEELAYVFLNDNVLASWPPTALNNLVDLTYLDLSNNNLTEFEPEYLHEGCQVILIGNQLTSSQQDFLLASFPEVNFVFE